MAMNVTLTSLLAQTRLLSDNHRLSDTQIIGFINQGHSMLHDKLVDAYGEDYKLKIAYFVTVNSLSSYPLSYNVSFTNATAAFSVGATLTGATSGAMGVIRSINPTSSSITTSGTLSLSDLSFIGGQIGFTINEVITDNGATTGSAAYTANNGGIGAADFYKLRGLDVQWQGANQYLPMKPFIWKDRNLYTNSFYTAQLFPGPYYRYRLLDDNVLFTPAPTAANIIRVNYTPAPKLLINGTDTLDGISGWEQYVINFARNAMFN